jgi:Tfp pilus assembly protein PilV
MKPSLLKQTGSILIEALVALVVVSVGTFGVMKLNTVLLSGTGISKTRAEALQIAQNRMETIRNFSIEAGCPAVDTGSTETAAVSGTNASYKVGRTISSVLAERVNVEIYVGWDGVADPHNSVSDKRIVLSSVVACAGTGTSGMVGGTANAQNAGKLKAPTGAARVGGRANPSCPDGSCVTIQKADGIIGDNTVIYKTGNLVELVDAATNKVLLTVEDGTDFSTISGRVYIEANNSGAPIVDPDGTTSSTADDNVFVLTSDASYCARIFPTDTASIIPAGQSGNGIKYRYFDYNCYVGAGWWGNIGIARLDNPNTNNRICVGDPATSLNSETSIWSRNDALSSSRGYRGYKKIDPSGSNSDSTNFETKGIGYKPGNQVDGVEWVYVAEHIGVNAKHDFLVTIISGNQTCEESGKMALVSGQFTGNQGRFFCMSGQCPDLIATPSTPTTIIRGTITRVDGAELTAPVVGTNSSCSSVTWSDNGGSYSYSCTLNWTGFSGAAWQGSIVFGASGTNTVCSSGIAATVVPIGNSVAFTVNNSLATNNPNSLTFTDVPLAVTYVTIDFNALATNCPQLGVPNTKWGNGVAPKDLEWVAITGATGYKVSSCSQDNSSDCTPTNQSSSQSGLSISPTFSPPSAVGATTKCFGVVATGGTGTIDSNQSATKCVTRTVTLKNNGSYDSDYANR